MAVSRSYTIFCTTVLTQTTLRTKFSTFTTVLLTLFTNLCAAFTKCAALTKVTAFTAMVSATGADYCTIFTNVALSTKFTTIIAMYFTAFTDGSTRCT